MDVLLAPIMSARLHRLPFGSFGRFRMTHARHHKSAFATALLECLTAIANLARGRHPLFGDELPHRLLRHVAAFPRFWIFPPNELHQLGRINGGHIIMRVIFNPRPLAQVEDDAAVLSAAKCDVVTLCRLVEAQSSRL